MIELTEPQVWTLIGVFAASMFSMLGIMTAMFTRVLDAKFEAVHRRLDGLDRDLQALVRRVFDRRE